MVQHWKIHIFYLFKYRFVRAASARWHLRNFLSLLNFCDVVVVVDSIQSRRNWKSTFGLLCVMCVVLRDEDENHHCWGLMSWKNAACLTIHDGRWHTTESFTGERFCVRRRKEGKSISRVLYGFTKRGHTTQAWERGGKSWKVSHLATMNSFFPSRWYWKNMESSKRRKRRRESLKVSMLSLLGNNLSWYRLVVAVVSSKLETFLSSFVSVSSSRSYRGENDYTLKIFGEKEGWISETEIVSEKFFLKFHSNSEKLPHSRRKFKQRK